MTYKYLLIYLGFTFILGCSHNKESASSFILGNWKLIKVDLSYLELKKYRKEVLDDFIRNEWILKDRHNKKYPGKEFLYNTDSLANQYFDAIMGTIDSGSYNISFSIANDGIDFMVKYNSLCNRHNGILKLKKDSLFIKSIISTETGCSMDRIHSPFGRNNSYGLNADTLKISNLNSGRISYYLKSNE